MTTTSSGVPPDMTERFSAYVVIPARIFFDKEISDRARLLYGLIANMCNDKGYCWAKNSTLSKYLGGASESTVRRLLRELRAKSYISVEDTEGGATVRKIFLAEAPAFYPVKNDRVPDQKWTGTQSKMNGCLYKEKNNKRNNTPIAPTGGDPAFDPFWAVYPKKVGKDAARRAFQKAVKKTTPEIMIRAVETQKRSEQWQLEGGRFIPNPATWLNQGRWEDDLPAEAGGEDRRRYL